MTGHRGQEGGSEREGDRRAGSERLHHAPLPYRAGQGPHQHGHLRVDRKTKSAPRATRAAAFEVPAVFTVSNPSALLRRVPMFEFDRNIASQTIARLKDVARRISNYLEAEHVSKERSASLDLLLRFQRLLVSKLYLGITDSENGNGYSRSIGSRTE